MTYKDSGVDIDAGAELVRRIAKMCPDVGGFGGLFPFGDSYLIAGTDGVGTKLKLAFDLDKHDTVGIDLVAMSVNDIITSGAKPLFFLDYFATGALDVDKAEKVIAGIVEGCNQSDCGLLGGETAEMPGFYPDGEYDLSGFAVGSVKKEALVDGSKITVGDKLVGLPSSGVHSNGFSLVRRVLAASGSTMADPCPGTEGTIGDALIKPTVIYTRQVLAACDALEVKGAAHITGGGFTENIPRVLPKGKGYGVKIELGSWPVLPIFKWIQENGSIEEMEMLRTFNMGIGMMLVMDAESFAKLEEGACDIGPYYVVGEVVEGEGVEYTGSME
ncbi:phosphoribosylformylglycinamidine cyclo-ligase [Cymbomonas tetramitiformis]|uniref:Phosphoribosylformylglycinamidine cyclo-ligase n=1 Tax=Cymbomonas tetramitiformis TaxID=36881 RepID=A0AAE0BZP9_9CHLO|nr:phosphoribosylformylglycinamidine cyclo-ligase [Cymbomonas tetramitiformis]